MSTQEFTSPVWLGERGAVNEFLFCHELLKEHPMRSVSGRLYDYDGAVDEDALGNEICMKLLEGGVPCGIAAKVSAITAALKHCVNSEPLRPDPSFIHVKNGKLGLDGEFIPVKEFCQNRLNVWYDPELRNGAYCPEKFLAFLCELLDPEDILTLQEYLGYLMIPSTKGQKMMFLIGQGGEGKSVIGSVLYSIFGQNMLTGSFQRIETDRFFRYNLKDKLVMVDDDTQMEALPSTGYIKNLVTALTPTDIEAKGRQSEQALLYTRLLCFGNGSPRALYDKSKGFSRRMLILTTLTPPKDRVIDPNIADRFIMEKDKIFCWMFDGLQRLIANNFKFTISDKTGQNIRETIRESCSAGEFMEDSDRLTYGEGLCVSSSALYDSYREWCEDNALTAMKRETFIGWVKQNEDEFGVRYSTNIYYKGKRVRGFRSITLKYIPS